MPSKFDLSGAWDEMERLSTALNRMIARLEDAFQHIHRFSGDASHELRTPLTILQLELEEIVQNPTLAPKVVDQIGSALEETQRLSRIIENLLTISRLDAGEVKMDKEIINLAELAKSTTEQMKAALLTSYIAYSGSCAIDEAAGKVTLKVEAAWRPDYVGTEQVRFFTFENGRLIFGPAPNSLRSGEERLSRRLTLERVH